MKVTKKRMDEAVFVYAVLHELGGIALTSQIRSVFNALGKLDFPYKRALKRLVGMGHIKSELIRLDGQMIRRWEETKAVGTI